MLAGQWMLLSGLVYFLKDEGTSTTFKVVI